MFVLCWTICVIPALTLLTITRGLQEVRDKWKIYELGTLRTENNIAEREREPETRKCLVKNYPSKRLRKSLR